MNQTINILDNASKWPKTLPQLTIEQKKLNNEFVKIWHEVLAKKKRYQAIEKFNHGFPVRNAQLDFKTTLEFGAGLGEHLVYEQLTQEQERNYYCCELRENMAEEIRRRFPLVQTIVGDCQEHFHVSDDFFDRIIAIHVLEHLPNLPAALKEAYRLLNKDTGRFFVVIPTEGTFIYSLARKVSAERVYKKTFGGDYSWFHKREHINKAHEIIEELGAFFTIETQSFFPFKIPFVFANLCIGLVLKPRFSL